MGLSEVLNEIIEKEELEIKEIDIVNYIEYIIDRLKEEKEQGNLK